MRDATFACPDLITFTPPDELGLEVTGQRLESDCAVLEGLAREIDDSAGWCRRCGCEGLLRDSMTWRLAREPVRVAVDDAAGHGPAISVHRLRAQCPYQPQRRTSHWRN